MKSALIKYKTINAGILKETDEGYEFQYFEEYLQYEHANPVSWTLPLRNEIIDTSFLNDDLKKKYKKLISCRINQNQIQL